MSMAEDVLAEELQAIEEEMDRLKNLKEIHYRQIERFERELAQYRIDHSDVFKALVFLNHRNKKDPS